MTDEPVPEARWAGSGFLAALFYTWMYGTPGVFIVALVRRTAHPYILTRAQAESFGSTTDTLFIVSIVASVALPALGLLLSTIVRDRDWGRYFLGALGTVPVAFLLCLIVASQASTPLLGHVPTDKEIRPPVTSCAHDCPGG